MNTEQLHKYLISVNLDHLIPREFHLNYVRTVSMMDFFQIFYLPVFQEVLVNKILT